MKKRVSVCLEQSTDGLKLKRSHSYWYQVQLQLGVSEFTHADFVVQTTQDIHLERIEADHLFIESQLKVSNEFYISGILPELLDEWHTRSNARWSKDLDISGQELFCCCRCGNEESLLLSCGNVHCIFKKFHLKCCDLSTRPSSKKIWYCVDCRRLNKVNNASENTVLEFYIVKELDYYKM